MNRFDPSATTRRDVVKLAAASVAIPALANCAMAAGPTRKRTAVVVGGGIGGLSAAYDLRKAGFDVTVMEKWDFIGGRMRDAVMGGFHFMPHAEGVLQANKEMYLLAGELGVVLDNEKEGNIALVDNGHGQYLAGLRFHIDEVVKIPGLSQDARDRIPLLEPDLQEIKRNVDPCLLATGTAYDNESLQDYYERKLGKAVARELIDNYITSALGGWGWPIETTSKIALLSWQSQQQARCPTPKEGIGVLTRKLGSMLPVQLNTTVRYITPPDSSGRHTIHYLSPDLQARTVTPDVVVVATEGKFVPELVQGLTPKQDRFFRAIDFTTFVAVTYILSPDAAPKEPVFSGYTRNYPDPVKSRIAGWGVLPAGAEHPDNPPVAHCFLARSEVPAWQASGKTQPDYSLPFLKAVYPSLDESKITDAVTRGSGDLIYMPVGYVSAMADILKDQENGRKGLYFAGEYMAGAHTGAACASGRTVARTIVKHWS